MAEFRSPGMERVRELCRRLRPLLGKSMDLMLNAYLMEDAEGRNKLEQYIDTLAAKHLPISAESGTDLLVPPSSEALQGLYALGTAMYVGNAVGAFGLRENEWIQHVGVFGRSGAGKTNLGFQILRELVRHDKPALVFDWKRNYRDLLALPEFENVKVYTAGRNVAPFRFNPLVPPPNTEPRTWLKQIIEVIAHAYLLGNGVLFLLQETLDAAYVESGVYRGQVDQWPTFRDILTRARDRNARGRESAWLSSTLRALASLTFGEMDTLLNTAQDQTQQIKELLNETVILEMDALGQADKVFLTSALLLYIHHLRMADGQREVFKHATVIEEAHHLLSNERRSLIGGQSVMEITFREIREFGEAVIALDQHPSKISLSALGNTYCTICFNLKHQKDVNAMAQSMLLDGDEKDILGSLGVGEAVVKLQGRTPKPFTIRVPEFEVKKGLVTDDEIRRRFRHVEEAQISDGLSTPSASSTMVTGPDEPELTKNEASTPESAFLEDVHDYPESGVAARYQRLGISVRQGQKLKTRLAQEGLIEDEEIRTPTGRLRVIRLTERGRMHIEKRRKAA